MKTTFGKPSKEAKAYARAAKESSHRAFKQAIEKGLTVLVMRDGKFHWVNSKGTKVKKK